LWTPHSFVLTALIPTLNYLGFGLVLFQATQIPFPKAGVGAWLVRPFDYLGKHSYSIYLWHLPVKQWVMDPLVPGQAGLLYFVGFVVASLAVGTFFSEILEMPVLQLRNRLFPSRTELKIPAGSETVTVPA
jgi:peptidoglycan/LPS O-acetylase OafA/YrhL